MKKTVALCFLMAGHVFSAPIDSISAVVGNAKSQVGVTTGYDPSYRSLKYPKGDVSMSTGVCTDVIIRAFRAAGVDLQLLVHEDMSKNFNVYPKKWGLRGTDSNIDHRRVPNLQRFFDRKGKSLSVTDSGRDYRPGDIVTWKIPGELDHIGLVSDVAVEGTDRFGVVHNIGGGAQLEDMLFMYRITGHWRYFKK